MARVRGSKRRAPPPREPEGRDARSTLTTDNIDSINQPQSTGRVIDAPISNKRRADDATPERHLPKKAHLSSAVLADDATTDNPRGMGIAKKDHVRSTAHVSLAGMGSSLARLEQSSNTSEQERTRRGRLAEYGQAYIDDSTEGALPDELSWKDVGAAGFEKNEVRRMQKYQKDKVLGDEVHDRVLGFSNLRNRTPPRHWGLSKLASVLEQKGDSNTAHDTTPRTGEEVEDAQSRLALKGEGKPLPLSPPFRIAEPNHDYEPPAVDIEESWPRDFPEPSVYSSPIPHVAFPLPVHNKRLDRDLPQEYLDCRKAMADQAFKRFLRVQAANSRSTDASTMARKETVKLADLDANQVFPPGPPLF